ncbi:hypothetical protein PBS_02470 [Paraburkholderia sp. 2C]
MLGMARTAVELLMEKIDTRGIAFTNYGKQAEASVTHLQIGEATEKIDAAEAIIRNSMRLLDEVAAGGQRMSTLQRARIWRDAAYASQLIWEGVDRIAGASGTAFVKRDEPLNLCGATFAWRPCMVEMYEKPVWRFMGGWLRACRRAHFCYRYERSVVRSLCRRL